MHARGPRRVRRIHAPLKRSRRGALEHAPLHLKLRHSCQHRGAWTGVRIVPRRGRARADASTRDLAGARVFAGPQSARGALAIRRRRCGRICVVPFRRAYTLPFAYFCFRRHTVLRAGYTRYAYVFYW